MGELRNSRLLLLSTAAAYCLIGVEIVIMISPFAVYFYAVYGPILDFFAAHPLLSWTTEFFLPHMVFVDDPLILGISYLQVLLVVGLLLFFSAAVPLYYGRFTKKGVVQMSFYSKIRHPQYLFLAISGFGLLLYWPRFIILILYVTMLFVYYLLARNEEWRMQQEAPERYVAYMEKTPMFLPGEPGARIYALCFGWIRPKWFGILVTYAVSLALAVWIALGVRAYAVQQLPTVAIGEKVYLPVFPRSPEEISTLAAVLDGAPEVQTLLRELQPNLAYIFPGDYFLTAIVTDQDRRFSDDIIERFPEVLEWHQNKFRGGLGKFFKIFYNFVSSLGSVETDFDVERIVFVRVVDASGLPAAKENLFDIGMKRTPVLLVDLDAFDERILTVIKTSGKHKWGAMPMPSF